MRKKKKQSDIPYSNFIEISIDPALFNSLSNESGMSTFLSSLSSSEGFRKLRNELIKEVMNIVNVALTDKQKEVIMLTYVDGKTQNEISDTLGTCQTNIHKAIRGNIDYSKNKKRYGGALKKIQRLCAKSKKIQDILNKIREKNEEHER
jgi:DNA-directed RNA polymerase specialized sigma24 family protein